LQKSFSHVFCLGVMLYFIVIIFGFRGTGVN
jgi:hypothetical protein